MGCSTSVPIEPRNEPLPSIPVPPKPVISEDAPIPAPKNEESPSPNPKPQATSVEDAQPPVEEPPKQNPKVVGFKNSDRYAFGLLLCGA